MVKRKKQPVKKVDGVVYIIKIWLDSGVVYKAGTTNRTALKRLVEIGQELIGLLGYWPRMVILKEDMCKNNYQVEADLLKQTAKHGVNMPLPEFSGRSELRQMEEDVLLAKYAECIAKDYPVIQPTLIQL